MPTPIYEDDEYCSCCHRYGPPSLQADGWPPARHNPYCRVCQVQWLFRFNRLHEGSPAGVHHQSSSSTAAAPELPHTYSGWVPVGRPEPAPGYHYHHQRASPEEPFDPACPQDRRSPLDPHHRNSSSLEEEFSPPTGSVEFSTPKASNKTVFRSNLSEKHAPFVPPPTNQTKLRFSRHHQKRPSWGSEMQTHKRWRPMRTPSDDEGPLQPTTTTTTAAALAMKVAPPLQRTNTTTTTSSTNTQASSDHIGPDDVEAVFQLLKRTSTIVDARTVYVNSNGKGHPNQLRGLPMAKVRLLALSLGDDGDLWTLLILDHRKNSSKSGGAGRHRHRATLLAHADISSAIRRNTHQWLLETPPSMHYEWQEIQFPISDNWATKQLQVPSSLSSSSASAICTCLAAIEIQRLLDQDFMASLSHQVCLRDLAVTINEEKQQSGEEAVRRFLSRDRFLTRDRSFGVDDSCQQQAPGTVTAERPPTGSPIGPDPCDPISEGEDRYARRESPPENEDHHHVISEYDYYYGATKTRSFPV